MVLRLSRLFSAFLNGGRCTDVEEDEEAQAEGSPQQGEPRQEAERRALISRFP
jgi:hypothetical protein